MNYLTLGGIVEVGVNGRATDDVVDRKNHGRDVLLDNLGRVAGVDQVRYVQGQLESRRKNAEDAVVDQAVDSLDLQRIKD